MHNCQRPDFVTLIPDFACFQICVEDCVMSDISKTHLPYPIFFSIFIIIIHFILFTKTGLESHGTVFLRLGYRTMWDMLTNPPQPRILRLR